MENLLLFFLSIGLGLIYIVGLLSFILLIQLISYRVFKFNLYKFIKYILFDKELSK